MKYSVGDTIQVIPLRKTGTIIEILSQSKYKVLLDKLTMTCAEGDLKKIETKNKKKRAIPKGAYQATTGGNHPHRVSPEIDLHGKTVSEALHLIPYFISDNVLAGNMQLSIVHGIGTGTLKKAIHRYLDDESAVKRFEIDAKNSGVTKVYL